MTSSPAIVSIGYHYPERVLTNAQLAQRFGKPERWILERSGIATRRVTASESTSGLIVPAARAFLERVATLLRLSARVRSGRREADKAYRLGGAAIPRRRR